MPLILNKKTYDLSQFSLESEFEKLVEDISDYIFGTSTIYISRKKRIKGSEIVTIPDAYLIDMTDAANPSLFIIENEIVSHDPFKHIGIQLLKFATSFDEAKYEVRQHLMNEIMQDKEKMKRLEQGCSESSERNIDSYLDKAVYGEFKALVLIDEARTELHNVIQKINADISVLEVKAFKATDGEYIYQYDTLYDEDEQEIEEPVQKERNTNNDAKAKRRERRAKCDTIVVPAQEDGFKRVFIGENQWYAIRIGAAMKEKIKYIAGYQVAPVSAITHIAEVDSITAYQNTGKYLIKFKGPAREIEPIKLQNPDMRPQAPVYVKYSEMAGAKSIDDLLKY